MVFWGCWGCHPPLLSPPPSSAPGSGMEEKAQGGMRGAERAAGVPQLPAGQGDRRRRRDGERRKRRRDGEGRCEREPCVRRAQRDLGLPGGAAARCLETGRARSARTPPRIPPAPRMKEGVGLNSPPLSRSALRAQSRPPAGARARRLPRVRARLAAAGAMPPRPPLRHLSFSTWLSQREGEGARCSQKPFSWQQQSSLRVKANFVGLG